MRALVHKFRALMRDAKAATAIEYGLIVSLIVVAIMASLIAVGAKTTDMWKDVNTRVVSSTTQQETAE